MTTVEDVFERHFAGLTPAEVDAALSAAPAAGASPLTANAATYLAEHGGREAQAAVVEYDAQRVRRDRAVVAGQTLRDMLRTTVGLERAAELLGVSRSRVSHRISDQTIFVVTVADRKRIPAWQITDDGALLPGLAQIVPTVIDAGLHPLAVHAYMTTPQPELDDLTPAEFLVSGGPSQTIADQIAALAMV